MSKFIKIKAKLISQHWQLEDCYKKETGYDIDSKVIDNVVYYDEDYVFWLEQQIKTPEL